MGYYLFKLVISSILIVAVSEVAKRSSLLGAILASVPLVSVLAIYWLYLDTKDPDKVVALATSVFWLVLPSLVFFVALPLLLKQGANFYLSMALSLGITVGCYFLMVSVLNHYRINF